MGVSYNRLWKMLIDKNMKRKINKRINIYKSKQTDVY